MEVVTLFEVIDEPGMGRVLTEADNTAFGSIGNGGSASTGPMQDQKT